MKNTALVLSLLLVAACSDDGESSDNDTNNSEVAGEDVPLSCNPLAYEHDCLLPYPSDVFLKPDEEMPSGFVVNIPDAALPKTKDGEALRDSNMDPADGFGPHPSIVARFTGGVSPDGLPTVTQSTDPGSATLLLDSETGEFVPHIAEVYESDDPEVQLVALRPLYRLEDHRRYIVALQGLKSAAGETHEPTEIFAAIRDDAVVTDYLSDYVASLREDVLPPLSDAGVDVANLQLAWDFTTRTEENLIGTMLQARELAQEYVDQGAFAIGGVQVVSDPEAGYDFVIEGTFEAPNIQASNAPWTRVSRNPDGQVVSSGTYPVPFRINIPRTVVAAGGNARIVQFGHGFFGSCDEIISPVQISFAEEVGVVMACTDWVGMSAPDRVELAVKMGESPGDALGFAPRVHQAMINQIVFTHLLRTRLPELMVAQIGDTPALGDEVYFLGISQGHILGGTLMALNTIERGALNVGGSSFGFMMTRAHPFNLFDVLLSVNLDRINLLKFQVVGSAALDPIDPISYAHLVAKRPLDDPHKILMQIGVGDASVPNLSAEIHARSLGIPLMEPTPKDVEEIARTNSPADSALVYYDFGIEPTFADLWQLVSGPNDVHEAVRRTSQAREQMNLFFRLDGVVEHTCQGPCVLPVPEIN